MSHLSFPDVVKKILQTEKRFAPAAYDFVRRSLDQSLRKFGKNEQPKPSHVRGHQLLEGFRILALQEFGPLAKTVLNEWGIENCAQVGDIVFQLVQHGVLGKSETDRPEDFQEIWTFKEAFVIPFQPSMNSFKKSKACREVAPPPSNRRKRKTGSSSPTKKS
ncbi:MAG: hypothetical protein EBT48_03575 [Verrucomicrobia bacterium]|nr:hypothetical protein [Verrucomicrobiota bacterium]